MAVFSSRRRSDLAWLALGYLIVPGPAHAGQYKLGETPYRMDHTAPLKASQTVVADGDGYSQLRVEFNGIRGDRVPGYLYLPKGGDKEARRPGVLLQYGSGGDKSQLTIMKFGKALAKEGFVVLTIDSPGRGERALPSKSRFELLAAQFSRDMFLHYCGDYSRAIDYLASRAETDPDRLGYAGVSWGAVTGITFAAHDPRIKVLVSLVGGGGFLGPIFGDSPDNARAVAQEVDPVNHIALFAPRPLLLINANQDRLMSRAAAEALHKAAGKGSKVVWINTDHDFHGPDRELVGALLVQFLNENFH